MTQRRAEFDAVGVPMFTSPGDLATGLAAVALDAQARTITDEEPAAPQRTLGRTLDEHEGKALLETYGVPTLPRRVAHDRAAALEALAGLGGPVVVKILDAAVLHKSDVGGVHVGVHDQAGLEAALDAIDAIEPRSSTRRYLLEEMAPPGAELIVGATRDAVFGPVVLLALGGVAAELGSDPILRLAPLSESRAAEMVDQLPAAVLDGFRGAPLVDRVALGEVLRAVGRLVCEHDDVAEVDLNPVRITPQGPVALDALVVAAAREENDVQHDA